MRLVPVFTLETNNQMNKECLPKFAQRHNASSSIKTVNVVYLVRLRQHCMEHNMALNLEMSVSARAYAQYENMHCTKTHLNDHMEKIIRTLSCICRRCN